MPSKAIKCLLIANRGEIAVRIINTAHDLGIRTIAVFEEADRGALFTELADRAVALGNDHKYLSADRIIEIAKENQADAIHPGYGFLSENAAFACKAEKAGILFVGPTPDAIEAMGQKDRAKAIMEKAGVPVVPGYHGEKQDAAFLKKEAAKIGYPVLIKANAGGGGKGMRRVDTEKDFEEGLAAAKREAKAAFGDDSVLIEKFIEKPRHIEVQVFGDAHGNAIHLFERDCSLQRRHQKVVEEAPAPGMNADLRQKMCEAATKAAKAIGYRGAGTVEFIVDAAKPLHKDTGFYFMEMNTRLQVEHPVTEMITGVDLVALQIHVAEGTPLPFDQDDLSIDGHAVEVRIYAEDPARNFVPQTGTLLQFELNDETDGARVDTGLLEGDEVTVHYDPMIAKVIAHGSTRQDAIDTLCHTLKTSHVGGVKTNIEFLFNCLANKDFQAGKVETGFIDQHIKKLTKEPTPDTKVLAALLIASFEEWQDNISSHTGPADMPWGTSFGFRLNQKAKGELSFRYHGEDLTLPYEIQAPGQYILLEGDKRYAVEGHSFADDMLDIVLDGHALTARLASDETLISLSFGGQAFDFERVNPVSEASGHLAGPGAVEAPMPGKILEVKVKNGETVREGTPLILMEAMKMEYTLKAPKDGIVKTLSVKAGDQVKDGEVLVTLEDNEQ